MAKYKIPFNFVFLIFFVFCLVGLYWLSNLQISAGIGYLWLLIIGIIFIIIAVFAKYVVKLDFWMDIPISNSDEKSVVAMFLGVLYITILASISKIFALNFYTPYLIAPLAQFSTKGLLQQTFAALQAVASPFWSFFITVFSASVVEEIVLGFAFVAMGSLLAMAIRVLLKKDFGSGNEIWDFIGAMIFSIIFFTVLHVFNGTYSTTVGWNYRLFITAAIFRLTMNILIYKFAHFGLMFSIGAHAVNNAIVLGGTAVLSAFLTFPGGILLILVLLLLLIFSIKSFKDLLKEGDLFIKDFGDYD